MFKAVVLLCEIGTKNLLKAPVRERAAVIMAEIQELKERSMLKRGIRVNLWFPQKKVLPPQCPLMSLVSSVKQNCFLLLRVVGRIMAPDKDVLHGSSRSERPYSSLKWPAEDFHDLGETLDDVDLARPWCLGMTGRGEFAAGECGILETLLP